MSELAVVLFCNRSYMPANKPLICQVAEVVRLPSHKC